MESLFLATIDNYRQAIESPTARYLNFPTLTEFETKRLPELKNALTTFILEEVTTNQLTYSFNVDSKMWNNEKWCFVIMTIIDRNFQESRQLIGCHPLLQRNLTEEILRGFLTKDGFHVDEDTFVGLDGEIGNANLRSKRNVTIFNGNYFQTILAPKNGSYLATFWKSIFTLSKKINSFFNCKQTVYEYTLCNKLIIDEKNGFIKKLAYSRWEVNFGFLEFLGQKRDLIERKLTTNEDRLFLESEIVFEYFREVYQSMMNLMECEYLEDFLVEYKYLIHIIDSKGTLENKKDLSFDCINLLHYIQNELKNKYHENERLYDIVLFFSPSNKHLVGSPYTNPNLRWILDYVPKDEIDAYLGDNLNMPTISYWRNKTQLLHLRKYAQTYVGLKGSLKNWGKYEEIFDNYKARQCSNDIIPPLMIVRENAQFLMTILNNNAEQQQRRKMVDEMHSNIDVDNRIPTVVAMPIKEEPQQSMSGVKEEKMENDYNERRNEYDRSSRFEIKEEYPGYTMNNRERNESSFSNDVSARNFNLDGSDEEFETRKVQAKPQGGNQRGGFLPRQFF